MSTMNWRTKQRDQLARNMVKNKIKVHFERGGKMVHAMPTLAEARQVADDMQMLLDVVNGTVPADAADKLHGKPH